MQVAVLVEVAVVGLVAVSVLVHLLEMLVSVLVHLGQVEVRVAETVLVSWIVEVKVIVAVIVLVTVTVGPGPGMRVSICERG